MALKTFLDGSWTDSKTITLACVATDEVAWRDIEDRWMGTLNQHSQHPRYMHTKEAMALEGEFAGWDKDDRDLLVTALVTQLENVGRNPRLHTFTCSVDLVAHRRSFLARRHPPAARLCARIVFPEILGWYATFPDPILDVVEMYFDRREPFMTHIMEDWNSKRFVKEHPALKLIRTIAPAEMRLTPALQVADMIAWSRNRVESRSRGDDFMQLAQRIVNCIHGIHREVGPKAMAESTFREEGARALRPKKIIKVR